MIHPLAKSLLAACAVWLAAAPALTAQTLKSTKACRVEYRKNQAAIRKAKERRRDFLAACRKTPVGEETPIGDAAAMPAAAAPVMPPPDPAPAPDAAALPSPPPPPDNPAPAARSEPDAPPPPSLAEPATSTAPEAPKAPEASPQPDAKSDGAATPADIEPVEDHSLPRWWNWTMWLSAAAVLVAAGLFAVRGLMRIKKTGG